MNEPIVSYNDLIKEAFIDPIRTVTVIDDEYPTFKKLLNDTSNPKDDSYSLNVNRLQNIISMCHEEHKWSVDVFDGSESIENKMPSHLHHSDLIILDYHLEGDASSDDGKKARNIINTLNKNNHFNIILVHTKGNKGDIKSVFEDILFEIGFDLPFKLDITKETKDSLDDLADDSNHTSRDWLNKKFNRLDLLIDAKLYSDRCLNPSVKNPNFLFRGNESDISDLARETSFTAKEIIIWKILACLGEVKSGQFSTKWDWSDDSCNYISTGKVFIFVIEKSQNENPSQELYGALTQALNHLEPPPMHLLMAKMRYELDEQGMKQADLIVNNPYIQAGWLYDLLEHHDSFSAHDKAINLHWEQLTNALQEKLRNFSIKIINSLVERYKGNQEGNEEKNAKKIIEHFYKNYLDLKEQVTAHLNAYSCTMPFVSSAITTGSILKLSNEEIWLCLTPACDLIPQQNIKKWKDRIGENRLGLKCVKLKEIKLSTANENASTNEYIYINLAGKVQSYTSSQGNQNPTWDIFYLDIKDNSGNNNVFSINTVRCIESELTVKNFVAIIVGELRYEYALNFLHKLGTNQTRVGLDFLNQQNLWG